MKIINIFKYLLPFSNFAIVIDRNGFLLPRVGFILLGFIFVVFTIIMRVVIHILNCLVENLLSRIIMEIQFWFTPFLILDLYLRIIVRMVSKKVQVGKLSSFLRAYLKFLIFDFLFTYKPYDIFLLGLKKNTYAYF